MVDCGAVPSSVCVIGAEFNGRAHGQVTLWRESVSDGSIGICMANSGVWHGLLQATGPFSYKSLPVVWHRLLQVTGIFLK